MDPSLPPAPDSGSDPPPRQWFGLGGLASDLARREEAVTGAARRVRKREDPEAIHDLRVATRRLAEALRVWRDTLDPAETRRARRALRRLRRALGAAREFEVELGLIRETEAAWPAETRQALEPIVDRLQRRIKKARDRAAHEASSKAVRRILTHAAAARALLALAREDPDPALAAQSRVEGRTRAGDKAVAAARGATDPKVLHAVRIAIKKQRYAEECLLALDPGRDPLRVSHLRELQQALGRFNDRLLLEQELERHARGRGEGGAVSAALIPALDRLRRERALALAGFRRLAASRSAPKRRPPAGREAETGAAYAGGRPKLRAVHPRERRRVS